MPYCPYKLPAVSIFTEIEIIQNFKELRSHAAILKVRLEKANDEYFEE